MLDFRTSPHLLLLSVLRCRSFTSKRRRIIPGNLPVHFLDSCYAGVESVERGVFYSNARPSVYFPGRTQVPLGRALSLAPHAGPPKGGPALKPDAGLAPCAAGVGSVQEEEKEECLWQRPTRRSPSLKPRRLRFGCAPRPHHASGASRCGSLQKQHGDQTVTHGVGRTLAALMIKLSDFRNPHSSGWVKDGRHSDVVHVLCSALQRSSGADLWIFFRFFCLRMLSATSQMFRGTPAFNVNIGTWNTASTTCMEIVRTASSVPRPNSGDAVTREWCGFLLAISRIR